MKILWLAPEPPVPPLSGGRERAREMLLFLAQRHQIHLFTFAERTEMPLLELLRPRLAGITVVAYDKVRQSKRIDVRLPGGLLPDIVHVQGMSMLSLRPAGVPFVLDLHDIPSRIEVQFARLAKRPLGAASRIRRSFRARVLQRKEREALLGASGVIVCSEADGDAIVASTAGDGPSPVILRNGINLDSWSLSGEAPEPATILFPGALNWGPNIDAAKVLARQLLPEVRRSIPKARLMVAGRRPSPEVWRKVSGIPAVTVIPDPEQMQPLFARATIVAVPLRVATGSRLKILQALSSGRAVVSTPAGANGLDLAPGQDLWIAPAGRVFAEALVELLSSASLRESLQMAGRRAVTRYAWGQHLHTLDTVYPA